jgi:hypothetical protein
VDRRDRVDPLMAGLTNKILPGDALDATEVQANFDDLASMANDVQEWQVERGSVDTRHLTGTWREVGVETDAGPWTGLSAWTKVVPSGTTNWTCTNGEAVLAIAEVEVLEDASANCDVRVQIYVGGAGVAETIRHFTLAPDEQRAIQIAYLFEASASTHTIELYAQEVGGSATFSDAQIIVTRVHR